MYTLEISPSETLTKIGPVAYGTWSGGRFMHFGEMLSQADYIDCIRQAYDEGIRTFITSDVYGSGQADLLLGQALQGLTPTRLSKWSVPSHWNAAVPTFLICFYSIIPMRLAIPMKRSGAVKNQGGGPEAGRRARTCQRLYPGLDSLLRNLRQYHRLVHIGLR